MLIKFSYFNARVGKYYQIRDIIGKHVVEKWNSNGLLTLQICQKLDLYTMNTIFQQKDKPKTIWMLPGSKQWHMIMFLLVGVMVVICAVSALYRELNVGLTIILFVQRWSFFVKLKVKTKSVTIPKKLNVARLKEDVIKEEVLKRMDEIQCNDS